MRFDRKLCRSRPGRTIVGAASPIPLRDQPSPSLTNRAPEAALRVIPVIDLMRGQVVRAQMGDRASYRPLESPLSPTSDPVDVVRGLLTVYPFPTLYVADLDAIQSHEDNLPTLSRIRKEFPALQMWVDNGAADDAALEAVVGADLGSPILGSESQRDSSLIARHRASTRIVLSLDFRGDAFQGPQNLLAEPALWPQRVIVMTLARVGSGAGPDLGRLASIQSIAGGRGIYAAGGVRNAADLRALKEAGISGALIATALHDRRIVATDLQAV
jgi:phosphoribosylformimino-5-aminoimidazole carboxamide ribotide isomerase